LNKARIYGKISLSQERLYMGQKIEIIREEITLSKLREFLHQPFTDMVKFVADVNRGVMALGGEMHADAEEILLNDGSSQADLWGGNLYPDRGFEQKIQFESLINIRPSQQNNSLDIKDQGVRARVREIVRRLIEL